MCGFAGFFARVQGDFNCSEVLTAMGNAIRHRGPDDAGIWQHPHLHLGFSHRRLSILDLSAAGHQPMLSATGRYTIIFNGEIYNHLSLRQEVETQGARLWAGHSDTETLLACMDRYGFAATIAKLKGMFAIAVWDEQEQQLLFARDRLGEKPLYLGWCGDYLLFGSELKALRAHPAFDSRIDRHALAQYMRYSYVPTPRSIYAAIEKLPPGYIASVSLNRPGSIDKTQYWSLPAAVAAEPQQETSVEGLHQKLREAVQSQMISDVPLGAFLSGGVDSSLIVGLMQSMSSQPVKTFTIGFDVQEFNEAGYAADVARHLGTEHHEMMVSGADSLAVVPRLSQMYDEPFADSSQIPTYLVSALARQHVTVTLSGDGGDELFAGYSRYPHVDAKWQQQQKLPAALRHSLAALGQTLLPQQLNLLSSRLGLQGAGNNTLMKVSKGLAGLAAENFADYYQLFLTHLTQQQSQQLVLAAEDVVNSTNTGDSAENPITQMMYLDTAGYMTDDILVKVDRASMAASLESRVPMLDVDVIEYAFRMPLSQKYQQGTGKICLRQILDQYVPRSLIERPKKGFGVPLARWLRHELRDWADTLLDAKMLQQQGYLNVAMVSRMWREHLDGTADWHFQLWNILMFQDWLASQDTTYS
ncbi:asparagine synthase (glutamine-hydrolyzing) [Rheinheimera sp.]|uniref:asparagine synthase (glutamine-hydrolyzing) n=1 Tax=Rheinheimera sp. TaxID=1869214 RepID=UPI002FDDAE65